MTEVLKILTKGLEAETRRKVRTRSETLFRGINFLEQCENEHVAALTSLGWTKERLEVVCDLASFFQTVLGPIMSAGAVETTAGLGRAIPIMHGSNNRVDTSVATKIRAMRSAFEDMVSACDLRIHWLEATHANDLVFKMASHIDG